MKDHQELLIDHIIYGGSQGDNCPADDVESLGPPPGLHLNDYGSLPPGLRLVDGDCKTIPSWEWTSEDNALADQIYAGSRNRYLERLSQNQLIDLINMSESDREYLIEDNM